jgi:hypothetical protein
VGVGVALLGPVGVDQDRGLRAAAGKPRDGSDVMGPGHRQGWDADATGENVPLLLVVVRASWLVSK